MTLSNIYESANNWSFELSSSNVARISCMINRNRVGSYHLFDDDIDNDTTSQQQRRLSASSTTVTSSNRFHCSSSSPTNSSTTNSSSSPLSSSSSSLSDASHSESIDVNQQNQRQLLLFANEKSTNDEPIKKRQKRRKDVKSVNDVDNDEFVALITNNQNEKKTDDIRIDVDDSDNVRVSCSICGDTASGYHYGMSILVELLL